MGKSHSKEQLLETSRHVGYEFGMVEATTFALLEIEHGIVYERFIKRFPGPRPIKRAQFELNALLESHLVHVRNLAGFLFDTAGEAQKDEVVAEYYFDHPDAVWLTADGRGSRSSAISNKKLKRISREVAHITTHRSTRLDAGDSWNPHQAYLAIYKPLATFARIVDPSRVDPQFLASVDAALNPKSYTSTSYTPSVLSGGGPVATTGLH